MRRREYIEDINGHRYKLSVNSVRGVFPKNCEGLGIKDSWYNVCQPIATREEIQAVFRRGNLRKGACVRGKLWGQAGRDHCWEDAYPTFWQKPVRGRIEFFKVGCLQFHGENAKKLRRWALRGTGR